jgi:hypothetical protein
MTVVTTAATTSSTLPACNVIYTDVDSNAAVTRAILSTNAGNTLGTFGALSTATVPILIYAKSGVAVQYSTSSYASSGATAMQYAVHVKLEQMQ